MSTESQSHEPSKPLSQHKTEWTGDGRYRLDVQRWPEAIILTCETEGLALTKDERYPFLLGRVIVLTGGLCPDAERFAEHAFGFYSPELAALAVAELRAIFRSMPVRDSAPPSRSTPPRGAMN